MWPGADDFADHTDYQRVSVACQGRTDLSRPETASLMLALLRAVEDTMERGDLWPDDTLRVMRGFNELEIELGRMKTLVRKSLRTATSAGPQVAPIQPSDP